MAIPNGLRVRARRAKALEEHELSDKRMSSIWRNITGSAFSISDPRRLSIVLSCEVVIGFTLWLYPLALSGLATPNLGTRARYLWVHKACEQKLVSVETTHPP